MKKKITIEYEINEAGTEFSSKLVEGSFADLRNVFAFTQDKEFREALQVAMSIAYLRADNREKFMADFFRVAQRADEALEHAISYKKKS